MSRIGKKPITIPQGVKVTLQNHQVKIEGPKGILERKTHPKTTVKVNEEQKKIIIECTYATKEDNAIHGLTRSLVNNMVIGVTKGYEKGLEIIGTGYNAKLQGNELMIQVGFTHPVKISIPEGITATIPNPNLIVIQGIDKELIGQFAANIRFIRPSEPYNLKGIKYKGEVIKRKAGKTFVTGT